MIDLETFTVCLVCRMLMDPVGKKAFAIHFTKVGNSN